MLQAIRETDATQLDDIISEGAYLFLLMLLYFHEIYLQFSWMLCSNKSLENVIGAIKLRYAPSEVFSTPLCAAKVAVFWDKLYPKAKESYLLLIYVGGFFFC